VHLETVACAPAVNECLAWVQDSSKIGRKYIWRLQCWNQVFLKNPVALDLRAHVTLTLRPIIIIIIIITIIIIIIIIVLIIII
jgi:hypothetical protein